MFVGHFGVGFAGKAAAPRASLGTLVLASQFIDLLWPSLLLAGLAPLYPPDDPLIETVLHERGPDRILFAANPTAEPRRTVIHLAAQESLQDADTGELFPGPSPSIEFPEYTVRTFIMHGGCGAR